MLSCKCGSKNFCTIYEYKNRVTKRVMCLNCNRIYEIKGKERKEIDLDKEWKEKMERCFN